MQPFVGEVWCASASRSPKITDQIARYRVRGPFPRNAWMGRSAELRFCGAPQLVSKLLPAAFALDPTAAAVPVGREGQ